jgi:hypothetical protein
LVFWKFVITSPPIARVETGESKMQKDKPMIARGKIRKLLIVLGEIQDRIGAAKGLHDDDRSIGAFEKAQKLLQEAFELCVNARSEYDSIEE